MLPHTIKLVIGDWSGDGHSQTDEPVIHSNLTPGEVRAAYNKGAKIIGVDLVKNVAEEYEDNELNASEYEKFVAAGVLNVYPDIVPEPNHVGRPVIRLWTDSYLQLYLFTVLHGNPEFKYEIAKSDDTIHIGGYGLFYS